MLFSSPKISKKDTGIQARNENGKSVKGNQGVYFINLYTDNSENLIAILYSDEEINVGFLKTTKPEDVEIIGITLMIFQVFGNK